MIEVNGRISCVSLFQYEKTSIIEGYGNNLLSRTVSGQTLDYLYNGHADVTSLVDSTGTIQGTYYYDAFGNQTQTTGTVNNPYIYSGYQFDKESGLYYLNARMYDATTARFMQEDTYSGEANDPLSLNLYTYCHNEPMMYSDPSGHVYVLGNQTDLNSAKTNLGSTGNTFIDTTNLSADTIEFILASTKGNSIIVGGTGAVGGVGANVNTNGTPRLAGTDRTATANSIQNFANSMNAISGGAKSSNNINPASNIGRIIR
jgi:RHS repeat-associated protein